MLASQPRPGAATRSRAIVFAHFDPAGAFDPHVVHALGQYRRFADRLVVVSASAERLPAKLAGMVDEFVPRENVGYDFCSWRDGLRTIRPSDYDEVICVNDSVYGPLCDLEPALADPRTADADLWGMVLSDQAAARGRPSRPHLQSWFLGMRRPLLSSSACETFWAAVRPLPTKLDVIERYEIGFSEHVRRAGFTIAALYDATTAPDVTVREVWPHLSALHPRRSWRLLRKSRRRPHNPSELVWWRLLEAGVPYVKVGLFRVNHYGIDLQRVEAGLRRSTPFDLGLIHAHLARCG
jgi:lipopolysaccharide biosynthesis protein